MEIRTAQLEDAAAIVQIYNEYVLHTIISFETQVLDVETMRHRMSSTLLKYDWLVGEQDGQVIGYAYYNAFRDREAYNHTAESTIYLAPDCRGRGFGKHLYTALIESAKRKGFRELIGVIALPNPASILLHETLGFQSAGTLKNVGRKFDQYIDVGFWQLSLE